MDMLEAAQLVEDPRLRKLFFRHALDEARHARMFSAAAFELEPEARADAYAAARATRQDLFARMSLVEFVVFVHDAERAGQAHFAALARHFRHQPQLHELFTTIERDERYHVAYTGKQLQRWREAGRGAELRRARRRVRLRGGWEAWRRAGHQLADPVARLILALIYCLAVPIFALLQRSLERERPGWKQPRIPAPTLDDLKRQF